MDWQVLVVLFFIILRRFVKSLDIHGAAFKPVPNALHALNMATVRYANRESILISAK